MFTFRKNTIIKNKINQYLEIVSETSDLFRQAAIYHLQNGCDHDYKSQMEVVIKKESAADDLRREIEGELYRKSLLPEFREQILLAIDQLDEIPDKAEDIVKMIYNQNITVPENIRESMTELINLGSNTVELIVKAAQEAVGTTENIEEITRQIDHNESHGDSIDRTLIYDIFHQENIDIQTLVLKDYITEVGSILDIAQDVADTMVLIAIKRVI